MVEFTSGSVVFGIKFVDVCMVVSLSGSKVVGFKDFGVWAVVLS